MRVPEKDLDEMAGLQDRGILASDWNKHVSEEIAAEHAPSFSFIKNGAELAKYYGTWPSFHDAIIEELHLWRGHMFDGEWDVRNVLPVLTMSVRVLGATQDGASAESQDVVAVLRFHHLDDFHAIDFNHNNDVIGMDIDVSPNPTEGFPPFYKVTWARGFGLECSFRCFGIEVVNTMTLRPDESLSQPRLSSAL